VEGTEADGERALTLLAFLRRHHPDMALRLSDDARWSGAFGHSIAGRLPATPLEAATYEAREEAFVAGYRAAAIAFGRAPTDPREPPALEAVSELTGERQTIAARPGPPRGSSIG
jgi:hypothetical protein